MNNDTEVQTFIADLDGGVFEQKLAHILSEVAGAVVDFGEKGRKGQVQLTFDIKRIGNSCQVEVAHTLAYKRPTMHGNAGEDSKQMTPMYVAAGGKMTLFPEGQDQLFDKQGQVPAKV